MCELSGENAMGTPRTSNQSVFAHGVGLIESHGCSVSSEALNRSELPGPHNIDFLRFKSRPISLNEEMSVGRSGAMRSLCANKVPSSRYHKDIGMFRSCSAFVIGEIPNENKTGPKGSPCCTPLVEKIVCSPRNNGFGQQ